MIKNLPILNYGFVVSSQSERLYFCIGKNGIIMS